MIEFCNHYTLGLRGFVTDGAARGKAKLAWAIPSRDGGRQSQIRNYLTRGAGDPREQEDENESQNDNENENSQPLKGPGVYFKSF